MTTLWGRVLLFLLVSYNTQNCAKSSKNHMHPSWLSGNPKVWKISWWELTSPHNLPTMISVKTMYDVQKHLMHTEVQQHTYRRRIHHICNANCKTENIIYQKLSLFCLLWSSHLGLWSIMVAFSLPKESWWPVDLRCLLSDIRNANCKTENIIYLLECAIYGLQYVGETKQQLSKRLNGHSVEYILWTNWADCIGDQEK
jgi:hypothetical protein